MDQTVIKNGSRHRPPETMNDQNQTESRSKREFLRLIESHEQFKGIVRYKTCKKYSCGNIRKEFQLLGQGFFFQLRQKGRRGVLAFKFIKTLNLVIFVVILNRNYSNFSEKSFVLELCRLIGCPN